MKNIFILFYSLIACFGYSQDKVYTFYVELNNFSNAPTFEIKDDKLIYSGKDSKEAIFFSKYTILEFYQSFPNSGRERTLNFFTVSSFNKNLINEMIKEFPVKYLMTEDISEINYQLASTYTNDYGSTSPFSNLGVNVAMDNYDYINLPKAWDFTKGKDEVLIGISDAKLDTADVDFKYKTTILDNTHQSLPYDPLNQNSFHGTGVAALAAAQGDNGHGTVGVCSNCSILKTRYGNYNKLLELAQNGVRIINMSWVGGYSSVNELVVDELYEDYNAILIASAGNQNPWDVNPSTGIYYMYPASYDNVISVTGINHKYNWSQQTEIDPIYGEISRFVRDQISPYVATNYQGNGPFSLITKTLNYNDKVDICAPSYHYFRYAAYLGEGIIAYSGNTSAASPFVSGTAGLMLSVDECLINREVYDILKLTSKNVEIIDGNEPYVGKIGSGKMETGDAVEFVYNMNQPNGNAKIDNHDFYRFNFKLNRINNKLTIDNQIFRDSCRADFTARNIIEVLANSDFKPNDEGFIDLKIDSDLDMTCTSQGASGLTEKSTKIDEELTKSPAKLYPNPNNGTFEIIVSEQIKGNLNVEVYDIYGKVIYNDAYDNNAFSVNIPNLSSGIYIVRLSYNDISETIKFIKE